MAPASSQCCWRCAPQRQKSPSPRFSVPSRSGPVTDAAKTSASQPPAASPWFPFGTGDDAPVRLLCLPHAGAGASVYGAWGRGLPEAVAACAVQPPGRERRRAELPVTTVAEIARRLAPEIVAMVRPPYAIF